MNGLRKNVYDCFYTLPKLSQQEQEAEECRKARIRVPEKPEQSLMAEERSIDSFISGQAYSFFARRRYPYVYVDGTCLRRSWGSRFTGTEISERGTFMRTSPTANR